MPHVLHLLKPPVPEHALSAIQRQSQEPDTTLTVVLREGAGAPPLPSGVRVRRLTAQLKRPSPLLLSPRGERQGEGGEEKGEGDPEALTYSELLDLIFAADQVISW